MSDNIKIIKETFRHNVKKCIIETKYQIGIIGDAKYLLENNIENAKHQIKIINSDPDPIYQDIVGAINSVFDYFLD